MLTDQQLPVYYIKWADSGTDKGWRDVVTWERGPIICETVALVLHQDKKVFVVTSTVNGEGQYLDQLTIPRRAILELKELK